MPGTKLTELTLQEVKQRQRGGFIFAAGRYQGIPDTLAGFTNNGNETAKFNKATQDAFALWLINQREALRKYIYGESYGRSEREHLTQACLDAAQIWASLPIAEGMTVQRDGRVIQLRRGDAYYGGVGVNTSKAKIDIVQMENILTSCRASKSPSLLLPVIARAEVGTDVDIGYDVINAGKDGAIIPLPGSVQYLNRIAGSSGQGSVSLDPNGVPITIPGNLRGSSGPGGGSAVAAGTAGPGGAPTQMVPSVPTRSEIMGKYIEQTYHSVLAKYGVPYSAWQKMVVPNFPTISYQDWLSRTYRQSNLRPLTVLGDNADQELAGDIYLLSGISSQAGELQGAVNTIMGRLQGFSPAEQYLLVSEKLFEFFPDNMRNRMGANAGSGLGAVTTPHAWRAPGKVAMTATLTIPGASGFRIGQVFWVGRTYENFKNFGVFQLFGLTENIDVNRGWTTQLYSRFNAIPKTIMLNRKSI